MATVIVIEDCPVCRGSHLDKVQLVDNVCYTQKCPYCNGTGGIAKKIEIPELDEKDDKT